MNDNLLLVPIKMEALVVGKDASKADRTPSYMSLGNVQGMPPLPAVVMNTPFTSKSALPGVHLHWFLPDSLRHGCEDGKGSLIYPRVPNRWIVQRIFVREKMISRAAWLIESDFYTNTLPKDINQESVFIEDTITIPMYRFVDGKWIGAGENGEYYAYLGYKTEYGSEKAVQGKYLERLTAVGMGDPLFAAYYQNCRSVFGFHDRLEDIESGTLTYVVCGFFDKDNQDPLYNSDGRIIEVLNNLEWSAEMSAENVSGVLLHSMVCGVCWEGADKKYAAGALDGQVDVTIANTSAEALSLIIKNRLAEQGKATDGIERMLTALQYQMLNDLDDKSNPDAGLEMEEQIHKRQFQQATGGSRWYIRVKENNSNQSNKILPRVLYDALRELNSKQEELNANRALLDSIKTEIYFAWCKLVTKQYRPPVRFASNASEQNLFLDMYTSYLSSTSYQAITDAALKETINKLLDRAENTLKVIADDEKWIKERLDKPELKKLLDAYQAVLEMSEGERYFIPNNPVLMFSGDGINRGFLHSNNNMTSDGAKLACRTSAVSALKLNAAGQVVTITAEAVLKKCGAIKSSLMKPVENILAEAILISPDFAQILAICAFETLQQANPGFKYQPQDVEALKAQIEQSKVLKELIGTQPLPLAVTTRNQPWSPLCMEWELTIDQTRTDSDNDNSFDAYELKDIDMQLKTEFNPSEPMEPLILNGSAIMTPHAAEYFGTALLKLIEDYDSDEGKKKKLNEIAQEVKKLNILSQSIDGFNDALIMRKSILQLPIVDPKNKNPDILGRVVRILDRFGKAPDIADSTARFMPLRAGFIRQCRIRIIDTFGQEKELKISGDKIQAAESMRVDFARHEKQAALMPRVLQPCCLRSIWLSHGDESKNAYEDPSESPIFGFIMPNFIDRALLFYDEHGILLGSVQCAGNGAKWISAPNTKTKPEQFASKHLADFEKSLEGENNHALEELLACMDYNFNTICSRKAGKEEFLSLCFGNIIALARASVKVEQQGLPAYIQGWESRNLNGNYQDALFSIKIGDIRKIDDGLIGYYCDEQEKSTYKRFYTHTEYPASQNSYVCSNNIIRTSLSQKPQKMTVLIDPFSYMTMRTGIIPASRLELPSVFYKDAVEEIESMFRLAPVLQTLDRFAFMLPGKLKETWSFIYAEDEDIKEIIDIEAVDTTLQSQRKQIIEGFLKASNNERSNQQWR